MEKSNIRQAVQRKIKPYGKIWVRIFAHLPVSSKPSEVRMGKGKGNFSYWSGVVKKGQILFEISGVSRSSSLTLSFFPSYIT